MKKEMNGIPQARANLSMTIVVVSGKKRARAIQPGLCGAVLRVFGQRGLTGGDKKNGTENESEAPERALYALRRN